MRLVQVVTSEVLAVCLTKIQSTPRDSGWRSNPVNRFELGRKDRAEERCGNSTLMFDKLCGCFSILLSLPVLCGTHHTFYNEHRVDAFLSTQFCLCSAILVRRCVSNCGHRTRLRKTCLDSGAEDESHASPSLCRCFQVPSVSVRVSSQSMRQPQRHRTWLEIPTVQELMI